MAFVGSLFRSRKLAILISVSQRRFDLCGLCLIKSNERGRRNGGVGGECGGSGGGQKEDHRVLDLSRRGLGILSFETVKEPLSMSLILSFLLLYVYFLLHISRRMSHVRCPFGECVSGADVCKLYSRFND